MLDGIGDFLDKLLQKEDIKLVSVGLRLEEGTMYTLKYKVADNTPNNVDPFLTFEEDGEQVIWSDYHMSQSEATDQAVRRRIPILSRLQSL